jgi:hypothetical protein
MRAEFPRIVRPSLPFLVLLALPASTGACERAPAPDSASAAATASARPYEAVAAVGEGGPATADAGTDANATDSGPPASSAPFTTSNANVPVPIEGEEFLEQARALFRVGACGPSGEIPSRFDPAVVARYCEQLGRASAEYKKSWVDVAVPFLAALRPRDLPNIVVYPFGGGDLVSALATFPDAVEITTISLEPAGDIRTIDKLAADRLAHELAVHRSHLERLFEKAHSRTDNLDKESKTELPGEILFALVALAVHGDEPVSLRYFRLRQDGSIAYVTHADIEAAAHKANRTSALHDLFQNVELRFRRVGAPDEDVRVARHIAYNLDDFHLKADPSLMGYLNGRPKVAAMVKAATHLLWNEHFKTIRGWLVDHADWILSDSTGLPPRIASTTGYTQDTYGVFEGPSQFGDPDKRDAEDLRHLFASEPSRPLAFRYGYPDKAGHAHLIVTHRDADRDADRDKRGAPTGVSAPPGDSGGPAPAPLPDGAARP